MSTPKSRLEQIALSAIRAAAPTPIGPATRDAARSIVESVRAGGELALRAAAARYDGLDASSPLVLPRAAMEAALGRVDAETVALLRRVAGRIESFAKAQRATFSDLDVPIEGGRAGHEVVPMEAAGCYAPGGRYPLPSSVLMTAVTARAAGVERVVVASPNPPDVTLAAAAIAGADEFLCVGGAHAVAALAYGLPGIIEPVHIVVGPGNRWVAAAKELVFGQVGIDLPAGPSELVVLADDAANASWIAADLLAQAEHDPDARPILISTSQRLIDAVQEQLHQRLATLTTAEVASAALASGFAALAPSWEEAYAAVDSIAPEHLQLSVRDPLAARARLRHFGAAFLGEQSAEVFGDYGAGPNHVLPTGGAARFSGGLSVGTFLRTRTWLRADDPGAWVKDAAALAAAENLEGHRQAAMARS